MSIGRYLIAVGLLSLCIGFRSSDFFCIGKMSVKLSNFIIIHKDPPSGFRIHDLPYKGLLPFATKPKTGSSGRVANGLDTDG
jgi:hypothetical protein